MRLRASPLSPSLVALAVLAVLAALAALACAGRATAPVTARPTQAPAPRAARAEVWSRFAEVASWPPTGEPFPNDGHPRAGKLATVRVSPEARTRYEHLVRDGSLPDGSLIAIFHQVAPGGPAGPVYVMEKSAGSWRYLSLGADGRLEPSAGAAQGLAPTACARCHQDGVADSLFGVPRPGTGPR